MSIIKSFFGYAPSGERADLYTIENASGASVSITNYGGIVVSVRVPDKNGLLGDVVLGCARVEDYCPTNGYVGALIGRVGNRIAHGECSLNGQALKLAQNSNGHHLHGGNVGFNEKIWKVEEDAEHNALRLRLVSPDGEENYPGTLKVTVTYAFSDDNSLSIHYEAASDRDTLCNLTNHSYFNLDGEGKGLIEDQLISIDADRFTVADAELIPTGELRDVTGTPFDLRAPRQIGQALSEGANCEQIINGGGFDHNFCLNGTGMREVVTLYSPATGRFMTVSTDLPGVQFYSGNMLGGMLGKCGHRYQKREGLCLETQVYPDAINHAEFPSAVLRAGEKYDTTTIYKWSVK